MSETEAVLRLHAATPAATRMLGALCADILAPSDVVLLSGELGAGKTTFVKGLVAALGDEETVTSPTFVLVHLYDTSPVVAHVDCWRLDNVEEVADLGLEELLEDGAIALVEWGDIAAPAIGASALHMDLLINAVGVSATSARIGTDGSPLVGRSITLSGDHGAWHERLSRLRASVGRNAGDELVCIEGSAA